MLSESKENAIVQWHNCVSSSGNLSSLLQLSDGDILRKDLEELFEYEVRLLPTSAKSISFLKDSDSRVNFEYVKKYIDESLQIKSEEIVSYEDCMCGNRMELAMVSVMALSITVRHRLESYDASSLLSHLDTVTQHEIVECMQLVMDHPSKELRKVEFHRILSRTAKFKERSIRFSNSPVKVGTTPRKCGRKPKKVSSDTPNIVPVPVLDDPSPVMKMLESPQVKVWSTTATKERELFNLRRGLDAAENKIIDQRCLIAELRKDLDTKGEEYQQLKEKYRKLQDDMDDIVLRNQSMDEKMSTADVNRNKVLEIYKTEMAFLKKQVETWKSSSEDFRFKLENQQPKEKEAPSQEQLSEIQLQLQLTQEEKGRLAKEVETLQDNLKEMQETVSVYKDKLQEKEKQYDTSTFIDMSSENVADIISKDYQVIREKLINEELQNARLRKLLEAKTAAYKELEAQMKCRFLEESISPKFLRAPGSGDRPPVLGHAAATRNENQLSIERMWSSLDEGIENGAAKKAASGRLWASYDQGNADARIDGMEVENGHGISGNSLNEIVLLTKQVFTAYGETRTLEIPNGVSLENGATYVKYLLQELLRREHSSSSKSAPFDTEKSEEVSLDSGVNLCTLSDPGTLPTVHEYESRDQRLLRECEDLRVQLNDLESEKQKVADENASLRNLCKDTMKLKDEYEKRNTQLTEKLGEVSNKLAKSERDVAEVTGQLKHCCKKYSRLKTYVLETEERLRTSVETYKISESKKNAKQEQITLLENNVKELQVLLGRDREARAKLSSRLDFLQELRKQLEENRDKMELELAGEKAKNKELVEEVLTLKKAVERAAWNMRLPTRQDKILIDVEHGENGDDSKSSYVRVNAVFAGKGNDSVLSGGAFNKSLHSTFVNEDEEDMFNHTTLPSVEEEEERLRELERRNTLCLPHMRTAYPIETQGYPDKKEDPNKKGEPSTSKRLPGIFKTPKSLHLMVRRREEEKKRQAGIKRPRLKL